MNTNFRKTLIAAAVAALISAPAWSATDTPASSTDAAKARDSQSQDAYSRSADDRSVDGASRARASDNALYSRTPEELSGMEVLGSDGEALGRIKAVVMDRGREDVHAVITSGGIMGLGSRETLVPLTELTLVSDDKVQANLTKETIKTRPEYKAEQYGELESDRRISDFSAFEPTRNPVNQTSPRADSDAASRSAMGVERSRTERADEMSSRMTTRSEMGANPLHRHTPKDLKGMEVIGSDGEKLGSVKAIVADSNREQIHAVISSGGFLGLGAREILVPLDELTAVGDKQLQADFSQAAVESLPEYQSRDYGELDADRPISEFSAFEPMKSQDKPAAKEQAPGQRY